MPAARSGVVTEPADQTILSRRRTSSWYLPPSAPARLREAAERYEARLEHLEALAQEIARKLDSR